MHTMPLVSTDAALTRFKLANTITTTDALLKISEVQGEYYGAVFIEENGTSLPTEPAIEFESTAPNQNKFVLLENLQGKEVVVIIVNKNPDDKHMNLKLEVLNRFLTVKTVNAIGEPIAGATVIVGERKRNGVELIPPTPTAYQTALVLNQRTGKPIGQANALNNLGRVYVDQGKLTTALSTYQEALILHQREDDKIGQGTVLNNLGRVYFVQGKLNEALSAH